MKNSFFSLLFLFSVFWASLGYSQTCSSIFSNSDTVNRDSLARSILERQKLSSSDANELVRLSLSGAERTSWEDLVKANTKADRIGLSRIQVWKPRIRSLSELTRSLERTIERQHIRALKRTRVFQFLKVYLSTPDQAGQPIADAIVDSILGKAALQNLNSNGADELNIKSYRMGPIAAKISFIQRLFMSAMFDTSISSYKSHVRNTALIQLAGASSDGRLKSAVTGSMKWDSKIIWAQQHWRNIQNSFVIALAITAVSTSILGDQYLHRIENEQMPASLQASDPLTDSMLLKTDPKNSARGIFKNIAQSAAKDKNLSPAEIDFLSEGQQALQPDRPPP